MVPCIAWVALWAPKDTHVVALGSGRRVRNRGGSRFTVRHFLLLTQSPKDGSYNISVGILSEAELSDNRVSGFQPNAGTVAHQNTGCRFPWVRIVQCGG